MIDQRMQVPAVDASSRRICRESSQWMQVPAEYAEKVLAMRDRGGAKKL
jgi:hypothetical protein